MLPNLQPYMAWGSVLAMIVIAAIAYALTKGWTFGKWMRAQIAAEVLGTLQSEQVHEGVRRIIEKERESNHFRESVIVAASDKCKQNIESCIRQHNESAEAHGSYRTAANAFVRAHTAEELMKHNESRVAHDVAFRDYPDRKELNGAIARVEQTVANNQALILEKLNTITTQLTDMKSAKAS